MASVTTIIREDAALLADAMRDDLRALGGGTVLLTGAAGFLCSYLLDVLAAWARDAAEPCRVLALDSFRTGLPDRVAHLDGDPHVTFIQHDVSTPYRPADAVD
jgi:nucleoside-diphosphate-sugar epimerase